MAKKRASAAVSEPQTEEPQTLNGLSPFQLKAWDTMDSADFVILAGEAGTGKSYVATAYGIQGLRNKAFTEFHVVRSPLEAGRGRMGLLPGAEGDKMKPWTVAIDAIKTKLKWGGTINYHPVCYLQGLTFEKSFVLVDECQNLTLEEFEIVATRIGKGSKVVFCGDPNQDSRASKGMPPFMEIASRIGGFGIYQFPEEANQRHPMVRKLSRAINKYRNEGKLP